MYHNEDREAYLDSFYDECYTTVNRTLRVGDIDALFDATKHWLFLSNKATVEQVEDMFAEILDMFVFIKVPIF